mgnify:FL=1
MTQFFRMALIALLLVNGCAVLHDAPPEERVAQRAQERVDLLRRGQIEPANRYPTPGYRTTKSPQEYARNWVGVGMWLSATIVKVECDDLTPVQRCEAVMRVSFNAPRQDVADTHLRETWLLLDGEWYLYQQV